MKVFASLMAAVCWGLTAYFWGQTTDLTGNVAASVWALHGTVWVLVRAVLEVGTGTKG